MIVVDLLYFRSLDHFFHYSLSLSKSNIRNCCFHHPHHRAVDSQYISLIIFYIEVFIMFSVDSHDNSYLSVEYINWVLLIDLTISINTSSRRKYRKRYIDIFSLLMKKNSHYMREVNKSILGTIYRILPQMLILMRYDYYRRTSW